MAHLNCLPPRAAGVNDWFFLLAHLVVGVGIKQNTKCKMLLCKIANAPVAAPRLMAASGGRSNGTLLMSKTSPAMTRIDLNSTNMKIYAYEIKQSVSKNFYLLLRTMPRLTALRTIYFPAITRNGFCFHIRKITSRRP